MKNKNFLPILIISLLFFIFGFITWLNGTLIPFLKIICQLNNTKAYFVAFAFYISYFFTAIPSSFILNKTGFKKGMALGLLIIALGTILFIPAAKTRIYSIFLTGLFIQGTGLSILQTASNPYVTIIGPIESAAKRISIMGVFNKFAGAISPLILGSIILKNIDPIKKNIESISDNSQKINLLSDLASKISTPYIIMTVILIILAFLLYKSPLPEIDQQQNGTLENNSSKDIFKIPYLVFGFIAIFLYVGAEVIAGDTIILYASQYHNIPLHTAKIFTSYTLIAMLIGYIIGIILTPRYISQEKYLSVSAMLGIVFSFLIILANGFTSVLFVALLGFANAIMWPAIWPLAINNLGKLTKIGSALLIMGIAGGAIMPILYGFLADLQSVRHQTAYIILIPCYAFILFYSTIGYKIKSW